MTTDYIVCAGDCETDPFLTNREPKPFAWEIWDGTSKMQWWGKDSTKRMMQWLAIQESPMLIYMHNGGKFDFHFILDYLESPLLIMGNRIVYAKYGIHEFRDSFAILPVGLAKYQKTKIDYDKFEAPVRAMFKKEILDYLHDDCRFLLEMVLPFRAMFGDKTTIASAAMNQFASFHKVEKVSRNVDCLIRPYYYGGRCEAFEKGIIDAPVKIYDVNSMYPDRMKHCAHPVSNEYEILDAPPDAPDKVSFITFEGYSRGALPIRTQSGLEYPHMRGVFETTSHEYFAALELGLIDVDDIKYCYTFDAKPFALFVDHFYALRLDAKANNDKLLDLFYKLILNSAYGKFGMDPDEFEEWSITPRDVFPGDSDEWAPRMMTDKITIWSRPAPGQVRYNVATAASVTGAARAKLMRGLAASTRPLYCDTDSVICLDMRCEEDASKLGAWKLEATGDRIAIGGRKLYAVWNNATAIKQANKGCKISADDILDICGGAVVRWENEAPSFSVSGPTRFVKRNIRRR